MDPFIIEKAKWILFKTPDHPIEVIKRRIYQFFDKFDKFDQFEDLNPMVSVRDNFDRLFIFNHLDFNAYYAGKNLVLRTHTTAHQNKLLSMGFKNFLITGDVYRNDKIDWCHYPIFHQMDALSIVSNNINIEQELLSIIRKLLIYLCSDIEYRINPQYFPYTDPSFEVEVKFNGKWLEVMGCGIVQSEILRRNNIPGRAWAFGIGLDRMAMIAYNISDIRHLWVKTGIEFQLIHHRSCIYKFQEGKYNQTGHRNLFIGFHRL